ncbi:hypothetical protein [Ekhidna sp.]
MNNDKKPIVLVLISLLLGFLVANRIIDFLLSYSVSENVVNQIDFLKSIKIYVLSTFFFFLLIALPLVLRARLKQKKLKLSNWWHGLVTLEVLIFIVVFFTAASDVLSISLILILFQPSVIINSLIMKKNS